MSDVLLERAIQALRATTAEDAPRVECAKSAMISRCREAHRKRGQRISLLLAIAAVLVGSLASASAWRQLPPRAFARVRQVVEPQNPSPPQARTVRAVASRRGMSAPLPASSSELVADSAPAINVEALPVAGAPVLAVQDGGSTTARSVVSTTSPAPSDAEAEATELRLYGEAHRIHFVDHDAGRAVAAWDKYLRDIPKGKLAVEARYNRAICLVRLGRTGEAKAALEPFAQGRMGGYRQAEATLLLDDLVR